MGRNVLQTGILGFAILGLLASGAWLALGNRSSTVPEPEREEIRIAIRSLKSEISPYSGHTILDGFLLDFISDTLLRLDEEGLIQPGIASSWYFDEQTNQFKLSLDRDLLNQLGITPKSVQHVLSRYVEGDDTMASLLQAISDGSAHFSLDGHTLSFQLKANYPQFPYLLVQMRIMVPRDQETFTSAGPYSVSSEDSRGYSLTLNESSPLSRIAGFHKVRVDFYSNSEKILEHHNVKPYDIILGAPFSEAGVWSSSFGLQLKSYSSMGFLHVVFNGERKALNFELRESVNAVFQEAKSSVDVRKHCCLTPIDTFLPYGLLPDSGDSSKKTGGDISTLRPQNVKKLEFIYSSSFLPPEYISALKKLTGGSIEFNRLAPNEFKERLFSGQYDMASFSYFSVFPDPDSFLLTLGEGSIPGVNIHLRKIDDLVVKDRFELDSVVRAKRYAKAFAIYDKEFRVIPLYQIKIPVLYHDSLSLPETQFQYLRFLWKARNK